MKAKIELVNKGQTSHMLCAPEDKCRIQNMFNCRVNYPAEVSLLFLFFPSISPSPTQLFTFIIKKIKKKKHVMKSIIIFPLIWSVFSFLSAAAGFVLSLFHQLIALKIASSKRWLLEQKEDEQTGNKPRSQSWWISNDGASEISLLDNTWIASE